MFEERAFLDAIAAEPEDDVPRLAFADWLWERDQGDRAELIRLQCELARLDRHDPRRWPLAVRERQLLSEHGESWRKIPSRTPGWLLGKFRRGFIETVSLLGDGPMRDHGKAVFASHPVHMFRLHPRPGRLDWSSMGRSSWIGRASELDMLLGHQPEFDLGAFVRDRSVYGLRSLRIRGAWSDKWLDEIQPGATFPRLQKLGLSLPSKYAPARFRRVIAADPWPDLDELAIHGRNLGQALTICDPSPAFSRLRRLGFVSSDLTGMRRFSRSRGRLERLSISESLLDRATILDLARSDFLAGLSELQLSGLPLARELIFAFSGAPFWHSLSRLSVSNCGLSDDADISPLTGSSSLSSLRSLDLSGNPLTPLALAHLANSDFPCLVELDIRNCGGDAGLRSFLAGPLLSQMQMLTVGGEGVTGDGLGRLCDAPAALGLKRLTIVERTPTAAYAGRIAASTHLGGLAELRIRTYLRGDPVAAALLRKRFGHGFEAATYFPD